MTPIVTFDGSFGVSDSELFVRDVLQRASADVEVMRRHIVEDPKGHELILVVMSAAWLARLAAMPDDAPALSESMASTVMVSSAKWARFREALRRLRPDFAAAIEGRRKACTAGQVVLAFMIGSVELAARIDQIEVTGIPTKGGVA